MSISETLASAHTETSSGLFAEAVGGIATIVLSIIALAGTHAAFLLAIASIVFGSALLLSAGSTMGLHELKVRMSGDVVAADMMSSTAAAQALTGVAAI